jgi:hypothetical protein
MMDKHLVGGLSAPWMLSGVLASQGSGRASQGSVQASQGCDGEFQRQVEFL